MRRSATDKFREDLRLQLVYKTLLRYGMDTALERRLRRRVPPRDADVGLASAQGLGDAATAVKLRMMLEELGPTYVKIGQIARARRPCSRRTGRSSSPSCRTPCRRSPPPRCASHCRGAGGATGGAVRLVRSRAVRRRVHRPGAPRHAAGRHEGGGQGPAALHPHDRPRRPRHHADGCPRGLATVGDGALAGPRRHARAVLFGRARGARLPRRDVQRASAGGDA